MFAALEDYLYNRRHPRLNDRVKRTFPVLFTPDGGKSWVSAYGLDMSLTGMRLFSHRPVPDGEVAMQLTLDPTHIVSVRMHSVWHSVGNAKGKTTHEYGMELISANAVDQELIHRWVAGQSLDPKNLAQAELLEIRLKPDDVDRLIPLAFQHRIFAELAERGRLAPPDPKHPPLVAYDYGGVIRYQGTPMHRLTIHSKVMRDESEDRYSTRVLFDESGRRIVILDGMTRPQQGAARAN